MVRPDDGDPGPSRMRGPVSASREHFNDAVYTSEEVSTSEEVFSSEEVLSSEEMFSSEEVISSEEVVDIQEDGSKQGATDPANKHFSNSDSSSPEQPDSWDSGKTPPALEKHEAMPQKAVPARVYEWAKAVASQATDG